MDPRSKSARRLFCEQQRAAHPAALQTGIHRTAVVEPCVNILGTVTIGAYTVIGQQGFGLEPDEDGIYDRIPHVGGVLIGYDVEIGSLCAIARGTVGNTVIEDHARIDDHVFIAHNVRIGHSSLVIAHAEISGSVTVEPRCSIGPGAVIREHLTIGEGSLVGIGACVVKDVPPGVVVAGNPARVLRDREPVRRPSHLLDTFSGGEVDRQTFEG